MTMGITATNRACFKSVRQDWATPRSLFEELRREFPFNLDVAASWENTKCGFFFDEKGDGLSQPWAPSVCWMNPPYGPKLKLWMKKAWDESQKGATVVCLVPARTDTIWFHDYALRGEVRFLKGRLRFGDGKGRATFPSCLVVFRPAGGTQLGFGDKSPTS